MKKTILHFIFDLGLGGAETMLVRVLKELPEYNNIVVTLYNRNEFSNELEGCKYICLQQRSLLEIPLSILKLNRIIKKYNADLVHTHLFWPTFIARFATPKHIPLISTIHAFVAHSVEYRRKYMQQLARLSYKRRKSVIIGVAKGISEEYFSFLHIKPFKAYALYTFVDTQLFDINNAKKQPPHTGFNVVSVGALRQQKNHRFLVEAFKLLKEEEINLHIYGAGPLEKKLQEAIDESAVRIKMEGVVSNMNSILPTFDLFVMSSTYEGFSLAVLESMAMKVPLLLSDIVSFREQCATTASFYELDNVHDFVDKIKQLASDKAGREQKAEKAYERVISNFTLQHHLVHLKKIYLENLQTN